MSPTFVNKLIFQSSFLVLKDTVLFGFFAFVKKEEIIININLLKRKTSIHNVHQCTDQFRSQKLIKQLNKYLTKHAASFLKFFVSSNPSVFLSFHPLSSMFSFSFFFYFFFISLHVRIKNTAIHISFLFYSLLLTIDAHGKLFEFWSLYFWVFL